MLVFAAVSTFAAAASAQTGAEAAVASSPGGSAGGAESASPATAVRSEPRPQWSHRNQGSLRVAGAVGYYVGVRYGAGEPCNPTGKQFCPLRSPVMVDAALGFGVADTVELEARFRVGEVWWNGAPPLAAGLGIRWYSNADSPLKFLLGAAGFVDFTSRGTLARYPVDFQVRAEQGLQYDVGRYFGFYFQLGETIGFARALALVIDGGLGIQLRAP